MVVSLVHTSLGLSYLIAHVLHYPPPPRAHTFVIGTAVINNNKKVTVFLLVVLWEYTIQLLGVKVPALQLGMVLEFVVMLVCVIEGEFLSRRVCSSWGGMGRACLSSAKLRSTDSVNPRAVLSRVRPRCRHLL